MQTTRANQADMTHETGQNYSFLFTDVEGSTRLWEQVPDQMSVALALHNQLLTRAIEAHNGTIFKNVGDGFCAVFNTATDALKAAINAQKALETEQPEASDDTLHLKVRIGLHSGQAEAIEEDYFGPALNHVARLTAAANGGQILLSSQFKTHLITPVELRDLGKHKLRDLTEEMHIYQVIVPAILNNYSAIRTLSARPTNLPVQLSSFIGREEEVDAICQRLRQPNVRLLTLFGPGGIGKTRLSLRVAANMRDEYENGVFFIALSPVTTEQGLIEAIATALKIEERVDTPLIESLKLFLKPRQILLVMDNFEQVVDAAPALNDLLANAERLKILVTSREELLIYGEQIYAIAPLTLPKKGALVPLNRCMTYSAISLFVDRVHALQPDFKLDDDNAQHIIDICHCLDGLPLAIELAAVRVREFSLEDILSQLNQRLDVLSRGARDLPARQRTIRGAIDWSYQLLPAEEQTAFIQLSVFVGSFTVDAVDTIIGAQYLNRLKEKSLVQQINNAQGEPLFYLLDTLRDFAREQLNQADESDTLREKHLKYYQHLVMKAEPELTGPDQMTWFKKLEDEQFNIQAALEWALAQDKLEPAAEMVSVLWRFWGAHSRLNTGAGWINQVLEHGDQLPDLLLAHVHQGAARLAILQSRYDDAIAHLTTSETIYTAQDEKALLANVQLSLGETAFYQGNILLAEHYFHTSLAAYEELGDHAGFARCLTQLGRVAHEQSNLPGAETLLEESLRLTRTYGSTESIAIAVNDLAEVFRMQGQFAQAAELYQESLNLYRDLDFDIGVAVMLHNLGQVTRKLGDISGAHRHLQEAISLLQDLEEKQVIAECFAALGAIYVNLNRLDFAITVLSAANRLIDQLGLELSPADEQEYQAHMQQAQSQVKPDYWQSFWEQGQTMPLERLVKDILQDYV